MKIRNEMKKYLIMKSLTQNMDLIQAPSLTSCEYWASHLSFKVSVSSPLIWGFELDDP